MSHAHILPSRSAEIGMIEISKGKNSIGRLLEVIGNSAKKTKAGDSVVKSAVAAPQELNLKIIILDTTGGALSPFFSPDPV